jgi:hypothetical protein
MLLPLLKCDPKQCCVTCPSNRRDVAVFLATCIELLADIVILDQNIDLASEVPLFVLFFHRHTSCSHSLGGVCCLELVSQANATILGTDLAHDLRARGFRGLVLIRSANSSTEDAEEYLRDGAVDCCLGKTQSHKDMSASIMAAYMSRKTRMRSEQNRRESTQKG